MQRFLGYTIESSSISECKRMIGDTIDSRDRSCRWLACLNPHSYAVAKKDAMFSEALQNADWLVPDGIGIVFAGKFLRKPLAGRITGFDVFEGIMQHLDQIGGRVFFLGSTDKTLGMIRDRLKEDYPNVELTGIYSPPFKPEFDKADTDQMISAIANANPDVLWIGMTAPKQEKWVYQNKDHLSVSFVGAIGAVFDFYSGQVKRSHPIIQMLGLEWLPRLLRQPRRLWRRMGVSAPVFVWDVLQEWRSRRQ